MNSHKRVAPADDPATALLKGMAMDIGKEVVAYVERMYPQAISATSGGFPLSLRNVIYNEIMAAMKVEPAERLGWLEQRKKTRRGLKRLWSRVRDTDYEAVRADPEKQAAEFADIKNQWWRDENLPRQEGEEE